MYVRKRKGKWQCIVRQKGIAVAQTFNSKTDAKEWGAKKETEINLGKFEDNTKLVAMRLRELLKLYFDKAVRSSKRPKILKYEIDLLCRFPIASTSLFSLSPLKLANFRDERLKAGKSPTTVRNYLKLISRAMVVGQRELGIPISNNPVSMIEKPTPNPARDRTLNEVELKRLFVACSKCEKFRWLREITEIAYYTLCRRCEIFKLNRKHIDWHNSTALIADTKTGKPRKIGLHPRVVEILKSIPRSVSGSFFHIESLSAFEKSFRGAVKRAKLDDFRFHDLRHTGATDLIEKFGWSTMELMQQGGWSSQQMAKRYSNISPSHLANKMKQQKLY